MLDEDYLNSLRDKEEEKQKLLCEIDNYQKIKLDAESKITDLEKQIQELE